MVANYLSILNLKTKAWNISHLSLCNVCFFKIHQNQIVQHSLSFWFHQHSMWPTHCQVLSSVESFAFMFNHTLTFQKTKFSMEMGFKWELLIRNVEIWDSNPVEHIWIIISSILWQIKWLTRDYELCKLRVYKWIICCLLLQRNQNDLNLYQQKLKTTSWKCHIVNNILSNISLP